MTDDTQPATEAAPQHEVADAAPQQQVAAPQHGVADAVARLQAELAALMTGEGSRSAAESLDNAVASLREVEQRNVTSVQLVALDGD
ncbi:MAG TPA: hypothetical protein VFU36_00275 [Jatrophihabitans sp.]|nr:hypothetical protein [Jatrophihabitans sp.]